MILEVVQSKWSLTWYDPLGPRMCVLELMNGHVLQTLREQLKVPGSRLEGSELLTSEFLRFRSRLNETSGGLGKIVKDTVNKLILEQKLPSTARNLFVTTPKTSTFTSNRKSTNLTIPVARSFLPAVAQQNSLPAF